MSTTTSRVRSSTLHLVYTKLKTFTNPGDALLIVERGVLMVEGYKSHINDFIRTYLRTSLASPQNGCHA